MATTLPTQLGTTQSSTTHKHRLKVKSINNQPLGTVCTSSMMLIKKSAAADPTSAPPAEPLPVLSVQQHFDPVRGDHHPQPGDVPRGPRLLRAHQHLPGISCPGRNIVMIMVMVQLGIFPNEAGCTKMKSDVVITAGVEV